MTLISPRYNVFLSGTRYSMRNKYKARDDFIHRQLMDGDWMVKRRDTPEVN